MLLHFPLNFLTVFHLSLYNVKVYTILCPRQRRRYAIERVLFMCSFVYKMTEKVGAGFG